MANVPNTNDFSLQDVVNAVNPTTNDLIDCFADATYDYYDTTYMGSLDRLSNFRNYGPYLSLDSSILYFDFEGYPCGNYYVTVTSNTSWYVSVDTSEIYSASCYPTSGSGNDTVYFYCGEINYDNYDHASQMTFYKTSDNSYLNSCGVQEYQYGSGCY